jgi:hypothetical protein
MPYPHRPYLLTINTRLVEALDALEQQDQSIAKQTTATLNGATAAPPSIGMLEVDAADGIFTARITDNSPVIRQINYFLEYADNANFNLPTVVPLGPSRNWRCALGDVTLYFRAYSAYPTSQRSAPVNFGSPTAVVGGGNPGPVLQDSAGSGTNPSNGEGYGGFGPAERGNFRTV